MKEEDIRKRDVLNRYLDLVIEDSSRFYSDQSSFQEIDCPACGSTGYSFQFQKIGFRYVQCGSCETLFVNPRPPFHDLMRIYADSPSTRFWVNDFFLPMAEARREKIFRPRAYLIADRFPGLRSGKLADIGAGFGLFLEEMRKLWPTADMVAIEPSSEMAKICSQKGIKVLESAVEDIDPSEGFDLMTAFELFEHLHDPATFISKVCNLLNPGGYLYMTTLNGLGFDIQILWDQSKSVFPPHHLNFFNPGSLEVLLSSNGFEIMELTTPGQLDWDILEGAYLHEAVDPGRFFKTLSRHGAGQAKLEFQQWLQKHNFSSHMRVIARKSEK